MSIGNRQSCANRMLISSTTGLTDSIYLLQTHTLEPGARKFKKKEDLAYKKGLQKQLLYRSYMPEKRIQVLDNHSRTELKGLHLFFRLEAACSSCPCYHVLRGAYLFSFETQCLNIQVCGDRISVASSLVSLRVMRNLPNRHAYVALTGISLWRNRICEINLRKGTST